MLSSSFLLKFGGYRKPGRIVYDDEINLLLFSTKTGWVACSKVRVEGKNDSTAKEFANGYRIDTATKIEKDSQIRSCFNRR